MKAIIEPKEDCPASYWYKPLVGVKVEVELYDGVTGPDTTGTILMVTSEPFRNWQMEPTIRYKDLKFLD